MSKKEDQKVMEQLTALLAVATKVTEEVQPTRLRPLLPCARRSCE